MSGQNCTAQLDEPGPWLDRQFGSADVLNAMRIYRENFRSSQFLDEPYSLVSAGPPLVKIPRGRGASRQPRLWQCQECSKRKTFSLYPPEEVEAFQANVHERQILEEYTDRALHGTAAQVA